MLSALRLSSSFCRACMVCCRERFSCRGKRKKWKVNTLAKRRRVVCGGMRGKLTASSSWLRERNRSLWLEMMESRESIWPWGSSAWGLTPEPADNTPSRYAPRLEWRYQSLPGAFHMIIWDEDGSSSLTVASKETLLNEAWRRNENISIKQAAFFFTVY